MNHRPARMEDARLFAVLGKVIAQQRVQVGVHVVSLFDERADTWLPQRREPRTTDAIVQRLTAAVGICAANAFALGIVPGVTGDPKERV